jgi:protein associated with RNAse G/E
MKNPKILRKRYIPDETVDISGDDILLINDDVIITRWKPIKPRNDFDSGMSCAFLQKGYKISKKYKDGKLLYWYCDIIEVEYKKPDNTYILTDLLADIIVYPDGTYEILDLDELSELLLNGTVSKEQAAKSIMVVSDILNMIYKKEFPPKICNEYDRETK